MVRVPCHSSLLHNLCQVIIPSFPAWEPPIFQRPLTNFVRTRDDTPLLAKVTVPTLIINGKQDGVITPQIAEAVHAAIQGSKIVGLDNCGHFPFFEQPTETTRAVPGFTAATPGGKAPLP